MVVALGMLSIVACDDLLEENIDPNSFSSAPVDNIFAEVERGMSIVFTEISYDVATKFVQHTEWPSKHWTFNLDESRRGEDYWEIHFGQIKNIEYIIDNSGEGHEYQKAVALTLKAWMYYNLTSWHGDIPFSEGGQAHNNINRPKYDKQEVVMQGILDLLKEANELLLTDKAAPLQGDFLLDNDVLKWRKFANSLKVRVLIAQSKQKDPTAELKAMMADAEKYPLMSSNDDQPEFYYYALETYPRSLHGGYYTLETFMCNALVDKMVSLNDERLHMYAMPTIVPGKPFIGIKNGETKAPAPGNASFTSALIMQSREVYDLPTVWMSYAELEFLLAEAAEKGWIDGGTEAAKAHYEKGIEASYNYCKRVLDGGLENGLNDHHKSEYEALPDISAMADWSPAYVETAGVKYDGDKLEKIATQKWIALYLDMEGYFSYRRTNRPALTFNPEGPNGGVNPLRFRYPEDERTNNEENYKAAVAQQGPDEWSTKMWLLK